MSINATPRQPSPKKNAVHAALRASCAQYAPKATRVALPGPVRHTNQAATAISA